MMTTITLSHDQQRAYDALIDFLASPDESVFVLSGYAGTGKTTLVKKFLDDFDKIQKTVKLLNPQAKEQEIYLSATTNKAAEALASITQRPAQTIHSLLGLMVEKDWDNPSISRLRARKRDLVNEVMGNLIFIDEASYIDHALLRYILPYTKYCKIIFIGDPAQLTPVKSNHIPVFEQPSWPRAELTEVVRQAKGNPIIELATAFRETVKTGVFPKISIDGVVIQHMGKKDFAQAFLQDFSVPGWHYNDSKIMAWTNKAVIDYNKLVREHLFSLSDFKTGDYALCNSYVRIGGYGIKTDQMVYISSNSAETTIHGVSGKWYGIDNRINAFCPTDPSQITKTIKRFEKEGNTTALQEITNNWIDLRSVYACTINKAQGSTYDRAYIDLGDIGKCHNGDLIARMLYVAVSRARNAVIFTGDFG